MKRFFDIIFSLCALIFFLPLGIAIALLIKLSLKGPLFYSCMRIGKNHKLISCWKFRTMVWDADKKLKELLKDPYIKKEWETYYKIKDDPRVHFIGKFLRKTSLDELPQFWSVLKGDLSVVGPRPVTQEEVEKYFGLKAAKILSVRPGLTGVWQISGRSLMTFEKRVQLDEYYVDHRSFALDLQIIFKTIPTLFCARGAF